MDEVHFLVSTLVLSSLMQCLFNSQISYAPKAGGIGPHVDNYDVFLLQVRTRPGGPGLADHCPPASTGGDLPDSCLRVSVAQGRGRRRWEIETRMVSPEEEKQRLLEGSPVRVFQDWQVGADTLGGGRKAWRCEPTRASPLIHARTGRVVLCRCVWLRQPDVSWDLEPGDMLYLPPR